MRRVFDLVRTFLSKLGKRKLPFFRDVELGLVARLFYKELTGDMTTRASAIAYNFLLALFPATIFFFSMLAYVPIENFSDEFMQVLKVSIPKSAFDTVSDTISDIVSHQRTGLASVGFIMAFIFSTNGIFSMMAGFNKTGHLFEQRSFWKKRLIAALITVLIVVVVLLGLTSLIVEGKIEDWIDGQFPGLERFSSLVFSVVEKLILLSIILGVVGVIYKLAPGTVNRWKFFTPGSLVATLLFWATSAGFSYYVSNFSTYNKLYGSLGTLIVIMLWLYFNSFVLLVGFELNVILYGHKKN